MLLKSGVEENVTFTTPLSLCKVQFTSRIRLKQHLYLCHRVRMVNCLTNNHLTYLFIKSQFEITILFTFDKNAISQNDNGTDAFENQ